MLRTRLYRKIVETTILVPAREEQNKPVAKNNGRNEYTTKTNAFSMTEVYLMEEVTRRSRNAGTESGTGLSDLSTALEL